MGHFSHLLIERWNRKMTPIILNTAIFGKNCNDRITQYDMLNQLSNQVHVDGIQVRGELFNPYKELSELKKIVKLCKQKHWKLLFSVPDTLVSKYKIIEKFENDILLGMNNIQELKFSASSFNEYQKLISLLKKNLNNIDFAVDIENPPNENGNINNINQLLHLVETEKLNLGFCFDSGNWRWIDTDSNEAFNKLKEKITIFHLKNIKNRRTIPLQEKGDYNWHPMVKYCNQNQIPIVLEYEIESQKQLIEQLNILEEHTNS